MKQKNKNNYNMASLFSQELYQSLQEKVDEVVEQLQENNHVATDLSIKEIIADFKYKQTPKMGMDAGRYFCYLEEHVVKHCNYTFSPKYIGHMTSALPYFIRPLSSLITAMNQNTVKCETSKSVTPMERQAIAMVHKILYKYSDEYYERYSQERQSTLGILTMGGTTANLTALWCARNKCFRPNGTFAGIEAVGVAEALRYYGKERAVIIGSVSMHYSIKKAADLLGIGVHNIRKVSVDDKNRIDLAHLEEIIEECRQNKSQIIAIIGIAGSTDNGAVDPLEQMAAIAKRENCHFHVDAAWGGPLILSSKYAYKIKGIELADTVTIDGHKQFYLPMGIGMLYFKDHTLAQYVEKNTTYIIRANSRDLGRYTLEGSKAAVSIYLHAALHLIGINGYAELIDEGIEKTDFFASLIHTEKEFELLHKPEINILLYHYIPIAFRGRMGDLSKDEVKKLNDLNIILQKTQREQGNSFVSRSVAVKAKDPDNKWVALRAVIANPLTTKQDLKEILDEQKKIAVQLEEQVLR